MFHVEQCQSVVLGLPHGGGVCWCFVFEPSQVQEAMRHDTTQLLLKHNAQIVSVFKNSRKEINKSPDNM